VLGPTPGNLGANSPRQKTSAVGLAGGCLVVFVILVIIGALAGNSPKGAGTPGGSGGTAATTAASATSATPDATVDLAVSGLTVVRDEYTRSITGVVRNNSDHKYGYAQVEINLYDKGGNVIGSTMANINNLEPGQTWKFSAPILEDAAVKFDVKDVSGF
jgi:hypothetical protein